jgi:hypothetical protein
MRNDDVLTGAERQMRDVLRPGDDRIRHVIDGALSSPRNRRPTRLLLVATGLALATAAAAVGWRAYVPPRAAAGLHISGTGSVLVVTSDDGRRWVVDARRDREASGAYVIAFPQ